MMDTLNDWNPRIERYSVTTEKSLASSLPKGTEYSKLAKYFVDIQGDFMRHVLGMMASFAITKRPEMRPYGNTTSRV